MPTAIPGPVKSCVIAAITGENCSWTDYIQTNLNNFEDVPGIIASFVDKFEVRPAYLTALLSCFSANLADLATVGVYFNSQSSTINNPVVIVDSNISGDVYLQLGNTNHYLIIFGQNTFVNRIHVANNPDYIRVAGGSQAHSIETTTTGSPITSGCVKTVHISSKPNIYSSLGGIETGSCIKSVQVGTGSYYGGEKFCNVTNVCADEISNITSSSQDVLPQSLLVKWNNPSNTAGNNIYYKLTNTNLWYKIGWDKDQFGVHGNFTSPLVGFAIFGLKPLTSYDIRLTNVCVNGFESNGLTVTQETNSVII